MSEDYEAPLYSAGEPRSKNDFLIHTTYRAEGDPPFPNVDDILRRHGIDASAAYTHHGVVVGARLSAEQLAVIRRDLQVEYVERDCVDHVARYFRHLGEDRLEGYIVAVVEGADAHALVARHNIVAAKILAGLNHIHADLSDEQRDRLRHEPDVEYVQNDSVEYAWSSPDTGA